MTNVNDKYKVVQSITPDDIKLVNQVESEGYVLLCVISLGVIVYYWFIKK